MVNMVLGEEQIMVATYSDNELEMMVIVMKMKILVWCP